MRSRGSYIAGDRGLLPSPGITDRDLERDIGSGDRHQNSCAGIGGKMERSGPERAVLKIQGRFLRSIRDLQQSGASGVSERRVRKSEIVNVDRVARCETFEQRADIGRRSDMGAKNRGAVDDQPAGAE